MAWWDVSDADVELEAAAVDNKPLVIIKYWYESPKSFDETKGHLSDPGPALIVLEGDYAVCAWSGFPDPIVFTKEGGSSAASFLHQPVSSDNLGLGFGFLRLSDTRWARWDFRRRRSAGRKSITARFGSVGIAVDPYDSGTVFLYLLEGDGTTAHCLSIGAAADVYRQVARSDQVLWPFEASNPRCKRAATAVGRPRVLPLKKHQSLHWPAEDEDEDDDDDRSSPLVLSRGSSRWPLFSGSRRASSDSSDGTPQQFFDWRFTPLLQQQQNSSTAARRTMRLPEQSRETFNMEPELPRFNVVQVTQLYQPPDRKRKTHRRRSSISGCLSPVKTEDFSKERGAFTEREAVTATEVAAQTSKPRLTIQKASQVDFLFTGPWLHSPRILPDGLESPHASPGAPSRAHAGPVRITSQSSCIVHSPLGHATVFPRLPEPSVVSSSLTQSLQPLFHPQSPQSQQPHAPKPPQSNIQYHLSAQNRKPPQISQHHRRLLKPKSPTPQHSASPPSSPQQQLPPSPSTTPKFSLELPTRFNSNSTLPMNRDNVRFLVLSKLTGVESSPFPQEAAKPTAASTTTSPTTRTSVAAAGPAAAPTSCVPTLLSSFSVPRPMPATPPLPSPVIHHRSEALPTIAEQRPSLNDASIRQDVRSQADWWSVRSSAVTPMRFSRSVTPALRTESLGRQSRLVPSVSCSSWYGFDHYTIMEDSTSTSSWGFAASSARRRVTSRGCCCGNNGGTSSCLQGAVKHLAALGDRFKKG